MLYPSGASSVACFSVRKDWSCSTMSRRRVVLKQQKPQGGGMQAAMKEVGVL